MRQNNSIHINKSSDFRSTYRLLKQHNLLKSTPIILSEGDSWFSTPLSMNLLDHLVFSSYEEQISGKVFFGKGGLFYRKEKSGDTAANIFSNKNVKHLASWLNNKLFTFDLVLLSAGGNDFVGKFLEKLFNNTPVMSVSEAIELVIKSGQYDKVYQSYKLFLDKINDKIPVIAHSYAYPQRMGQKAELTLTNIGLIAIFKKKVGDWISVNIKKSIPDFDDQKEFAKLLIDNFVERVLQPLADKDNNGYKNFSYVDLRTTINHKQYWHDEMHPNNQGFYLLAQQLTQPILASLTKIK